MNVEEIEKLKVADLKKELKGLGLSVEGKKAELVQRLVDTLKTQEKQILSGTTAAEDLDDASLEALEKNVLGTGTASEQTSLSSTPDRTSKTAPPAPKAQSTPTVESKKAEPAKASEAGSGDEAKTTEGGKKAISAPTHHIPVVEPGSTTAEAKLERAKRFQIEPTISTKEKKNLRAQRFGIETSNGSTETKSGRPGKLSKEGGSVDPEVLQKRAARFGIPVKEANGSTKIIGGEIAPEKLKARAERFGVVNPVAKEALTEAESKEKILKRKERFGAATDKEAVAEKKMKRTERFGPATEKDELELKKAKRAEKFSVRQ